MQMTENRRWRFKGPEMEGPVARWYARVHADIETEVIGMGLGGFSSFTTKATLEILKRRAYTPGRFASLAAVSPFHTAAITTEGIGLEVRLKKELSQ
ncbi:MAG: hypothetical protein E6I50_07035 [Chloroflexi bacterium]|nr:MAG: hypothetical protein E6I50_07035 [Chloroflexota bacterium]